MELFEVLKGLAFDGPDGAALEKAFRQSESSGRGILFAGMTGSGKTTAAMALAGIRGRLVIHCDVPEKVEALGYWRDWGMPDKAILLDELGRDTVKNDYGTKRDMVGQFVRELYAAWKEGIWRGRLYATTNLSGEELRRAYDESVFGRLLELCVPCRFATPRRTLASRANPCAMQKAGRSNPNGDTDPYADAGIDMKSDASRAATWWNATHKGCGAFTDALRILRVNLGVFDGRDCERFRAVHCVGSTGKLSAFVAEAFLFGASAERENAERWAKGVRSYVETAYAGTPSAGIAYNPDNARAFEGWVVPFSFEKMLAEWRESNEEPTDAARGVFANGGEAMTGATP